MRALGRWGKFSLVGAMGTAVQLLGLAAFNRLMSGHYLYASAAAIELALLHNFVWHVRYTWRDRSDGFTRTGQFARFHLSTGLVSMLGNLLLMRLFVEQVRLPLYVSNMAAIICCSMVNFCVGNSWVFPAETPAPAAGAAE
jgi:putative flippase GtrA